MAGCYDKVPDPPCDLMAPNSKKGVSPSVGKFGKVLALGAVASWEQTAPEMKNWEKAQKRGQHGGSLRWYQN